MEAVEAFSSQKSAILSNSVPHWHWLKHFPGSPKPWQCRTALCRQFWGDFRENRRDLSGGGGWLQMPSAHQKNKRFLLSIPFNQVIGHNWPKLDAAARL